MHRRPIKFSATFVVAALALVAWAALPPVAIAGGPQKAKNTGAKVVKVAIREYAFAPATITVHAGDTVEWTNEDMVPHSATADGDSQKPAFDSGTIAPGATWRYVAKNKGTFNYSCTLHPNMKGQVVVD